MGPLLPVIIPVFGVLGRELSGVGTGEASTEDADPKGIALYESGWTLVSVKDSFQMFSLTRFKRCVMCRCFFQSLAGCNWRRQIFDRDLWSFLPDAARRLSSAQAG